MGRPKDLSKLLDILMRAEESLDDPATLSSLLLDVSRMCRRKLDANDNLRRVMDSQDLGQDVLLGLVRSASQFHGDTWKQFWGFLSTLVDHQLASTARRHHCQKRDMARKLAEDNFTSTYADDSRADPLKIESKRDDTTKLLRIVNELPEPYRSVLHDRIGGADYARIAENQGISDDAARKRVSRALAMVKQRW